MVDRIVKRLIRAWHIKVLHKDPMEWQIAEWRKAGIKIGENCKIYSMLPCGRDSFLVEIGNNVTISGHVELICHDNAIIKASRGKYTDVFGKIRIGDNCFIGLGSSILLGVTLADDTIVGCGSVVAQSITTPGMVIAGNPARIICSREDYMRKNEQYGVNVENMSWNEVQTFFEAHPDKLITQTSHTIWCDEP